MLVDNLTRAITQDQGLGIYAGFYERAVEDASI
jgi:hypothetical protein